MTTYSRISYDEGTYSLLINCGTLPVDGAIAEAGHEPNGSFWDGVAELVAPDVFDRVELDSEGGLFAAYGARADVQELQRAMEPLLADAGAIADLISRAEASGFEFDD